MASAVQKITLASSRDIPFNRLVLSQSNVRRIKAGVSIEELAGDIARRGLLQGLSVRAVVDANGTETGMFEIPAGGRRYRALELLVKQKRLAKTAPVPCIVREGGVAEEDSLAENVQRAPLHPLDQFRAFLALREKGQSEEEIAAAFFVSVNVVKQRLKLASVSPRLLDVYAEDGMTLDQLMAFTVSSDHERQEHIFDRMQHAHEKQPYTIRRMLTENAVRACDKRAQFIGIDAYLEAGGPIMRDLFQGDDGGWLQDVGLVELMVAEKLNEQAARIAAEGWKWIEVAPDFPYGHTFGLRQIRGAPMSLSAEEVAARDALQAELDRLTGDFEAVDELPDDVDERLGEIETALEAFDSRPLLFDAADVARSGAFISITQDGQLRVERGYVRPEDDTPVALEPEVDAPDAGGNAKPDATHVHSLGDDRHDRDNDGPAASAQRDEDEELFAPISDRLMTELSAHRTLGLRQALAEHPEIAFVAALHALTLKAFYHYGSDSCLDLDLKSVSFGAQAPGLSDSACAAAITMRHQDWSGVLPKESGDLWDALLTWDRERQEWLFAHVVSLSANAVHEAWNRRPRALAHADRLAAAIGLDMAAAGWRPTVDTYLGRVTKERILGAVAEARGQAAADRLAHLKKGDMATEAEALLADSNWLPEPLRTPGSSDAAIVTTSDAAVEETATIESETAMGDDHHLADNGDPDEAFHAIAAE
jgi:ParB family chromosome partitioning protein